MTEPDSTPLQENSNDSSKPSKRRGKVCFGIFLIFLVYYVAAAAIQTPALKSISVIPVGGYPLGLLLSLGIFPMSWALIIIWFIKTR